MSLVYKWNPWGVARPELDMYNDSIEDAVFDYCQRSNVKLEMDPDAWNSYEEWEKRILAYFEQVKIVLVEVPD